MAAEFTPEELAMYILSLTVQDPDSLPEVEIARENHYRLNHQVMVSVVKLREVVEAVGDDRRERDRRGNGRRDEFKKEVVATIVLIRKTLP